jgi:hypothetical protein
MTTQQARDAERDAIVEWLLEKKKGALDRWDSRAMYALDQLARQIASNEHRKAKP